ncbi:hypothetical protein JAAARDRAFT_584831 [Jaapia argillacea MUCL 33604]|uniref:Uncharacterized protein n=1 Tax=Jaapia argillacea MUCL 33604 TaxID=933084 RepID=A0A067PJ24_9AGAM|nr:hypothetical protein JAAARDRAFT_584831 [Jaapia argillacea MUCL 33604]
MNPSILDLPSAHKHKIKDKGQIGVKPFLNWTSSIEAKVDCLGDQSILEMAWWKTPGSPPVMPSHEYIVLKLNSVALRVERDATSWASALGPNFRGQCKDTVTVSRDDRDLRGKNDEIVASLRFPQSVALMSYLTLLLDFIFPMAKFYNLYTFNCWWFAAFLWRNLAKCGKEKILDFTVLMEGIVSGRDDAMDPIRFSKMMHDQQLSMLQRFYGETASSAKNQFNLVSGVIELAFERLFQSYREIHASKAMFETQMKSLRREFEDRLRASVEEQLRSSGGSQTKSDT